MTSSSVLKSPVSPKKQAPRCGIHAALWIPTDENGELKRDSLAQHLNWLKERGLHGVLALGSTGEFARMDYRKRESILAAIVELADPLPVIANVSSIRVDEVIALGNAAKRFGAVGAAMMPPSFFPLPQADILEFFLRVAEKVDLPFYLYNYPEVTGNRIGLEVITAFADRAPMVGIKQSGNELSYHKDLIQLGCEKDFAVFTAADPSLAKFLEMGAAGCLGGLPNFIPEYMLGVYDLCTRGKASEAAEMSARLAKIGELISPLSLPHNVRSAMEARGMDPGAFKTVVSADTLRIYGETVEQMRHAFAEWKLAPFASK